MTVIAESSPPSPTVAAAEAAAAQTPLSPSDRKIIEHIFTLVGSIAYVPPQALNTALVLGAAGPAFGAIFLKGMIEGAEQAASASLGSATASSTSTTGDTSAVAAAVGDGGSRDPTVKEEGAEREEEGGQGDGRGGGALSEKELLKLAAGAMEGMARLLLSGEGSTADLVARVATPGGVTSEGIGVLEREGLVDVVAKAVRAAKEKADAVTRHL